MSEPELWTNAAGLSDFTHSVIDHRGKPMPVRRVPFDEAVERMARYHYEDMRKREGFEIWPKPWEELSPQGRELWSTHPRGMLLAALGEGA